MPTRWRWASASTASRAGAASSSASADDIAAELTGAILKDLSLQAAAQEVLLLVNGFGGTPLMELYLMVQRGAQGAGRAPA